MTPEEWLLLLADTEAHDQPECRRADTTRACLDSLAIVAFIAATSAEWGAFLRAEPEDVDLATWRVRVRGTKDAQRGGNRERVVPIVHLGHAGGVQPAASRPSWVTPTAASWSASTAK